MRLFDRRRSSWSSMLPVPLNSSKITSSILEPVSNKRIYPAIDIVASGTRRDDLLVDERTLARVWALRNHFADMTPVEAMEFLKDRISKTISNEEFLATIDK